MAIGWTEDKCRYLDQLVLEDKSHTAARRKRQRCENNWKLTINVQGPVSWMDKRTTIRRPWKPIKNLRQQAEQPSNRPILPSYQTRQRPFQERHRADRHWKWQGWSDSLSSSSPAWTGSQSWWTSSKWVGGGANSSRHTHSHAQFFLVRVAKVFKLTLQCSLCALSPKHSSCRAHVIFRTLLDPPLTSPSQSTPTSSSLLFPSPLDSCLADLPEQSPLTGSEPNAPVEVSSTEATPIIFSSKKGSIGSTCNSVDDLATIPLVSEIGERADLGMLASPLLSRERDKCEPTWNLWPDRESSEASFSHLRSSTEKPAARCQKHTKSSRDPSVVRNSQSERERKSSFWARRFTQFPWNASSPSCSRRTDRLSAFWSSIGTGQARIESPVRRQSFSFIRYAASTSKDETLPSKSLVWSFSERKKSWRCTEFVRKERLLQEDRMESL